MTAPPPPVDRPTTDEISLWRCEQCGKWSHAKRKPKTHKVAILTDHDYGTDVIGYRNCGPFAEFVARRPARGVSE